MPLFRSVAALALACCTTITVAAQSPARGVVVSGTVQDQTGAVLPGAAITLAPEDAAAPAPIVSDTAGTFRFERVGPGAYDLRVEFPGFTTNVTHIRVTARAPSALTIVMQIEGLSQEVSVSGGGDQTSGSGAANLDAVAVDAKALDDMPVLDGDVVAAVSRFLDSSALGTNGATIVVDGVEVNALSVSSSAVQQIKINSDPYAAEFMRPGRGRIEIITKPGGRDYSGTFNLRFRDSALYATNAFAATKPPEQRRVLEGSLGGPIQGFEKTNFVVSGSRDAEDSQSIVFADTLAGKVQANVATPFTNTLASATINRQQGEQNTISLRFSHQQRSSSNQGIGGINLPETGRSTSQREDDTTYSQQTIITPAFLHEIKLMVGFERQPSTSLSAQPRIVVNDAFVGGGAQADWLRTEKHFTLLDAVTWSPAKHVIKAGVNIPDWSWRGYVDNTNTGGTFYFSSLQNYALGQPYSFTQQRGDGHVAFLEKVIGLFLQDEIRPRSNLTIDLGVRYDWQTVFHDTNNVAPRASFAYMPDQRGRTVIRGGAGVFYDRTGPGPIQDLLRFDGQHLQQVVIVDPSYPNPLAPGQSLGSEPSNVVVLAPNVTIPYSLQYSLGVEQQLAPKTTIAVTFVGSHGYNQFLSRDLNAPAPPLFLARPDPSRGVVREIESTGTMRTSSLQVTLRGQMTKSVNGTAQYSYGRASNNTGGIGWMPPNSYDLTQEYGPADWDRRHGLELFGAWTAGRWFTLGASFEAYTGRPYSLTLGTDPFNTGNANARPAGVPRNSLRGPGYASLDLRWSHDVALSGGPKQRTLTLAVDTFNVLNRENDNYFVGNLSSPFLGQAVSASAPRRVQFSLRTRF
ncbi:MAG TPA: TonB-dependent receptor [Vicinamibacterales bacterium]|nr:TonB-dependent receptor [Vicinamibacterales bacterium]